MIEKEELIKQINSNSMNFENLNDEEQERYSKDKDVMLLLVKIDISNIVNAHTDLLNNENFMKNCLKEDDYFIMGEYLPEHLLNDRSFMEYAVEINTKYISFSPFVEDTEWIISLIAKDSKLFNELPDHVRENEAVVLATIEVAEEWSDILEGLSLTYLGNKDFVKKYLFESYDILNYISQDLQKDAEFVIEILKCNPNEFTANDLNEDLQENLEVLDVLISISSDAFPTLKESIQNNLEVVTKWVNEDISILHHIQEDMLYSKDFLEKIKKSFISNEDNEVDFPNVWQAIKAYEREDYLKEQLEKKEKKDSQKRKKV